MTSADMDEARQRSDAKRAAAADGYLLSQCPLGLHDNLYPGPDGECADCEEQGIHVNTTDGTAALRCPHRTLEEITGMSTEALRAELGHDDLCDHETWLIRDELADRLLIDANREGAAMLHAMHEAAQDRALAMMRRTPEERRAELAALRKEIAASGITATSPGQLDPEGERLARQEREN